MSITCSEIDTLSHFRQKSKVHFGIYLLRWLDKTHAKYPYCEPVLLQSKRRT